MTFDHNTLRFERITERDREDFFELYKDPVTLAHISDRPLDDLALTLFEQITKQNRDSHNSPHFWRIATAETRFIGMVGIFIDPKSIQKGQFGMMLFPQWFGLGIGTFALDHLMGLGFKELGLQHLQASFRKSNQDVHNVVNKIGLVVSGPRLDSQGIELYDCHMDVNRYQQLHE